jgi:hypothetical protein
MTVVLLVSACACRADDKAVRKELEAMLRRGVASIVKGGASASVLNEITTPDYTVTEADGRVRTRAEVIQTLRSRQKPPSTPAVTTRITDLRVSGDQADSGVNTIISVRLKDLRGEIGPKGKTHVIQNVGSSRITWVKTTKGWLMKKSVKGQDKLLIDGKPAPAPRPVRP